MRHVEPRIRTELGFSRPGFVRGNITSSSGKKREIWRPNNAMRIVHQRLLRDLGPELLPAMSPAATGSLEGCSPARNVAEHAGNRYFFQLDFTDAYGQVDATKLARILSAIIDTDEDIDAIEQFLVQYCFVPELESSKSTFIFEDEGQGELFGRHMYVHENEALHTGLAIGAATSPLLFNTYCIPLDEALEAYCAKKGLVYTRYLDDLTFSSSAQNGVIDKNERREIREIIAGHELVINPKKTRVSDVTKAPVIITGLQLNKAGRWQLTERYLRAAYARLESEAAAYGAEDMGTVELAAGLNGLLVASQDKRREKLPETQVRLVRLINIILRKKLERTMYAENLFFDDDGY